MILNRQTPNHAEKNVGNDYWESFIKEVLIKQRIKLRLQLGVFGEKIIYEDSMHESVFSSTHIYSFQEWCSLISHPKCKAVISTISGGVYPIFFTGHSKSKLIIIDEHKQTIKHANSPSFYNDCINFTGVTKKIFHYMPTFNEIINEIPI